MDTPRDVRGFAVKFYTKEGNWDLVGNNIPVFFIQDAIKFPDLIHAVKMEPDRGFPQSATAHDTFWDFISLTPEVDAHGDVDHVRPHNTAFAADDRGFRHSQFSAGQCTPANRPSLNSTGVRSSACSPRFGTRPLRLPAPIRTSIAATCSMRSRRAISRSGNSRFSFSPRRRPTHFPSIISTPTKLIPEELVPLKVIGRMVLDRWPNNFFAETEQVAYCPSHVVPGIDFSNDPLLQGRLFSYLDTQLSRLGSPNFHQIPMNAPKCPFANQQRDGHMQMEQPVGPRRLRAQFIVGNIRRANPPARAFAAQRLSRRAKRAASAPRALPTTTARHGNSIAAKPHHEQAHIASALVFELSKVENSACAPGDGRPSAAHRCGPRADVLLQALAIRKYAGCRQGRSARSTTWTPSPAMQIIGKMKDTLKGRTVGILIADGSDAAAIKKIKKGRD